MKRPKKQRASIVSDPAKCIKSFKIVSVRRENAGRLQTFYNIAPNLSHSELPAEAKSTFWLTKQTKPRRSHCSTLTYSFAGLNWQATRKAGEGFKFWFKTASTDRSDLLSYQTPAAGTEDGNLTKISLLTEAKPRDHQTNSTQGVY